jgi:outer membrane murein-binding lipoprotein Lpp
MTGFIRGFFGRKGNDEANEQPVKKPEQPAKKAEPAKKVERAPRVVRDQQTNAFFLESDDAKSLGNLEYMRTSKTIRRTFPKTVNNAEMELIQKVSALETAKAVGDQAAVSALTSDIKQTVQSSNAVRPEVRQAAIEEVARTNSNADRRAADSSLDMFRNMAKDLRKPK